MNKKMRELITRIGEKQTQAKFYMTDENKDIDKANAFLDEADALKKEYEIEERIFNMEKDDIDPEEIEKKAKDKKNDFDGFKFVAKMLRGEKLNEVEQKAADPIIRGDSNGTNYLLPDDVRLEIRELRRQYQSAKDLLNIIPTSALTGSTNWETGVPAGLESFSDGDAVGDAAAPTFNRKTYNIDFYGKLIPISNIVQGAEKAQLMSYLNRWFVKNSIITENAATFTALKSKGSPTATAGWKALRKATNINLDPDCLIGAKLVTNQTGFDILDEEVDDVGRPLLVVNPADATQKLFNGFPIRVFSDGQLPNLAANTAPMFVGDMTNGGDFWDYDALEFAMSDHYGFNKNQTYLRVMEGFDIVSTDTDSYLYLSFTASA